MKNFATALAVLCVGGVCWWFLHTPEIQWHDARLYVGKRVTVVGPIVGGELDAPEGVTSMIMGTANQEMGWQSSLHILMLRKTLAQSWDQKALERGTVMKWTGRIETGVGNSIWLLVRPLVEK